MLHILQQNAHASEQALANLTTMHHPPFRPKTFLGIQAKAAFDERCSCRHFVLVDASERPASIEVTSP